MQEQAATAGLYFDAEKLNALVAEKAFASWAEPINSSFQSASWYLGKFGRTYVLPEIKDSLPTCNFWTAPRHTFRGDLIKLL